DDRAADRLQVPVDGILLEAAGLGDRRAVDAVADRPGEGLVAVVDLHREDGEARARPEQERVVVVLDLRRRAAAQRGALQQLGRAGVGDVEELDLDAGRLVGRYVAADPQQQSRPRRVQVGRIALQLELPG